MCRGLGGGGKEENKDRRRENGCMRVLACLCVSVCQNASTFIHAHVWLTLEKSVTKEFLQRVTNKRCWLIVFVSSNSFSCGQ